MKINYYLYILFLLTHSIVIAKEKNEEDIIKENSNENCVIDNDKVELVDEIVSKLKTANIKFGIGGVGKVNCDNLLPAENILCEHYRLGSSMSILARAFCDWTKYDVAEFEQIMTDGIAENREFEKSLENQPIDYFNEIHKQTEKIIETIKANR